MKINKKGLTKITAPYKIGDIVKPKPNYERCATVCGQCCKHKTDKS
ncbi:MAG: hypothetical protein IJ385_06270 [Ruminiclostridium sp.]|nr:hypothetical protein [Ruminiclostridium sp.]